MTREQAFKAAMAGNEYDRETAARARAWFSAGWDGVAGPMTEGTFSPKQLKQIHAGRVARNEQERQHLAALGEIAQLVGLDPDVATPADVSAAVRLRLARSFPSAHMAPVIGGDIDPLTRSGLRQLGKALGGEAIGQPVDVDVTLTLDLRTADPAWVKQMQQRRADAGLATPRNCYNCEHSPPFPGGSGCAKLGGKVDEDIVSFCRASGANKNDGWPAPRSTANCPQWESGSGATADLRRLVEIHVEPVMSRETIRAFNAAQTPDEHGMLTQISETPATPEQLRAFQHAQEHFERTGDVMAAILTLPLDEDNDDVAKHNVDRKP